MNRLPDDIIGEALRAADPAAAPDEAFLQHLQVRLRDRATALSTPVPTLSIMQKYFYALGGAVAAAVILPVAYLAATKQAPVPAGAPLFPTDAVTIEQAANREAFGSLSTVQLGEMGGRGGGGGGMGGDMAVTNPVAPMTTEAYGSADGKMIAPDSLIYIPERYEYVYNGEITGLTPEVSVLKRETPKASVPYSTIADRLNFGSIDLGAFAGTNLDSITITQEREFGYYINLNLRDGSVNINPNWGYWPGHDCQTEACYRQNQVKIGDLLSDEEVIRIARAFAEEYGIDLSAYGEPKVDSFWRRDYERAEDKSMAYVPETQRVVFPQLVDGKPVYDQSGMTMGLSIGVHAKHKRVADLWGLMKTSYQKSAYDGVTDPQQIKDFLTTIDRFPAEAYPMDQQFKTTKVVLGTPTVAYATFYRYDGNRGEDLVAPALIFPVESVEGEGYIYRQNVVVPLAAEMLKPQDGGVMPMPMPVDLVR